MATFHKPDYIYRVTVDRVVDGDTVDVLIDVGFKTTIFKRLRLVELDTEELRDSDEIRRENANLAKERMEQILAEADRVYIQTYLDSTGKYGRLLATIWVEKDEELINVNEQMVTEGFQKAPR